MNKIVRTDMLGTIVQHESSGEYFGICARCAANIKPSRDTIKATSDALAEHNDVCPKKSSEV